MYQSPLYRKLWIIVFVLASTLTFAQNIYINELISSNSGIIEDPDFGNTGDWIELYNDSNIPKDLSNHYLSDNLSDSTKCKHSLTPTPDHKNILALHHHFFFKSSPVSIPVFVPSS